MKPVVELLSNIHIIADEDLWELWQKWPNTTVSDITSKATSRHTNTLSAGAEDEAWKNRNKRHGLMVRAVHTHDWGAAWSSFNYIYTHLVRRVVSPVLCVRTRVLLLILNLIVFTARLTEMNLSCSSNSSCNEICEANSPHSIRQYTGLCQGSNRMKAAFHSAHHTSLLYYLLHNIWTVRWDGVTEKGTMRFIHLVNWLVNERKQTSSSRKVNAICGHRTVCVV